MVSLRGWNFLCYLSFSGVIESDTRTHHGSGPIFLADLVTDLVRICLFSGGLIHPCSAEDTRRRLTMHRKTEQHWTLLVAHWPAGVKGLVSGLTFSVAGGSDFVR